MTGKSFCQLAKRGYFPNQLVKLTCALILKKIILYDGTRDHGHGLLNGTVS